MSLESSNEIKAFKIACFRLFEQLRSKKTIIEDCKKNINIITRWTESEFNDNFSKPDLYNNKNVFDTLMSCDPYTKICDFLGGFNNKMFYYLKTPKERYEFLTYKLDYKESFDSPITQYLCDFDNYGFRRVFEILAFFNFKNKLEGDYMDSKEKFIQRYKEKYNLTEEINNDSLNIDDASFSDDILNRAYEIYCDINNKVDLVNIVKNTNLLLLTEMKNFFNNNGLISKLQLPQIADVFDFASSTQSYDIFEDYIRNYYNCGGKTNE